MEDTMKVVYKKKSRHLDTMEKYYIGLLRYRYMYNDTKNETQINDKKHSNEKKKESSIR
jgi:hypothetical protein